MEHKKCKKKFSLAFKKTLGGKVVANKQKLKVEKPADTWNQKKRKWTKLPSQMGYKALTVHEIFSDIKDVANESPDFKSCVKFVGRSLKLPGQVP